MKFLYVSCPTRIGQLNNPYKIARKMRQQEGAPMGLSRREFFKVGTGSAAALLLGFDARPVLAQAKELKIARTTETRSTCPYCSVSCGVIIHTLGDKAKNVTTQVVHVEGDPDHPINRGTLCPKGASLFQEIKNDRRLTKPQVRRPGSTQWEDISWDKAYEEIARHIKTTRDATFVDTDTNEFNYLVVKTMRSLGVCYIENQARV